MVRGQGGLHSAPSPDRIRIYKKNHNEIVADLILNKRGEQAVPSVQIVPVAQMPRNCPHNFRHGGKCRLSNVQGQTWKGYTRL